MVDPINTGTVLSKAWAEAVVQRLPEYLDQTDSALTGGTALGDATDPTLLNTINKTFGRRLKVVSFRWLSPSDI